MVLLSYITLLMASAERKGVRAGEGGVVLLSNITLLKISVESKSVRVGEGGGPQFFHVTYV